MKTLRETLCPRAFVANTQAMNKVQPIFYHEVPQYAKQFSFRFNTGSDGPSKETLLHLGISKLFGIYILLESGHFTIFEPPDVSVLCIDGFSGYRMDSLISSRC